MARIRYEVMCAKRDLIRNARAQAVGDEAAQYVGVSGLDQPPQSRGVGDPFDVPSLGAGHMAANEQALADAEFEAVQEAMREVRLRDGSPAEWGRSLHPAQRAAQRRSAFRRCTDSTSRSA